MVALSTKCDFPLAHPLARQDLADGGLGEWEYFKLCSIIEKEAI